MPLKIKFRDFQLAVNTREQLFEISKAVYNLPLCPEGHDTSCSLIFTALSHPVFVLRALFLNSS